MNRFFINLIPVPKWRHELQRRLFSSPKLEINSDTKCLMVAPHADDEMIGGGGIMLMHPNNFDVVVMGSSGILYKGITAQERSDIRIKEFTDVMKAVGIKNHWIFNTFNADSRKQIDALLPEYLRTIDTRKYDYIFLPLPHDAHIEHQYVTNKIFKQILRKNRYKKDLKIAFYEVWGMIPRPNVFIDITAVADKKEAILRMYKSQHILHDYASAVRGKDRFRGNQNADYTKMWVSDYSEVFYITRVQKYLHKNYNVNLNG